MHPTTIPYPGFWKLTQALTVQEHIGTAVVLPAARDSYTELFLHVAVLAAHLPSALPIFNTALSTESDPGVLRTWASIAPDS